MWYCCVPPTVIGKSHPTRVVRLSGYPRCKSLRGAGALHGGWGQLGRRSAYMIDLEPNTPRM